MPSGPERPRRVSIDRDGPVLVEGPVEVVAEDGTVSVSDRFMVAVCTCRRSRTYPWCDTSHRGRRRPGRHGPESRATSPDTGNGFEDTGRESPEDTGRDGCASTGRSGSEDTGRDRERGGDAGPDSPSPAEGGRPGPPGADRPREQKGLS